MDLQFEFGTKLRMTTVCWYLQVHASNTSTSGTEECNCNANIKKFKGGLEEGEKIACCCTTVSSIQESKTFQVVSCREVNQMPPAPPMNAIATFIQRTSRTPNVPDHHQTRHQTAWPGSKPFPQQSVRQNPSQHQVRDYYDRSRWAV